MAPIWAKEDLEFKSVDVPEKGLGFISVKVLLDAFMSGPNGIFIIDIRDLHALFKLEKMDVSVVAASCL
uniref:Uncharacterized protein n=1 Tax=Oryza meridionalis TaxID=40149 RepID=A0A0E0DQB3_9ORYZ